AAYVELTLVCNGLMESPQNRQLTRRGQGRFRFVEDVEAIPTEAVEKEGEKGLPVRLLVKRPSSVRVNDPGSKRRFGVHAFDVGRDIEKALGPEEEAVLGTLNGLRQSQVVVQLPRRGPRGKPKIDR